MFKKKATNSTAYKAMTAFLTPLNPQNGDYYTGRLLDSKLADIKRMALGDCRLNVGISLQYPPEYDAGESQHRLFSGEHGTGEPLLPVFSIL